MTRWVSTCSTTSNRHTCILHKFLEIAGKTYTSILKEAQFDVVSDEIIHADFLLAPADKPVTIELPVVTTGIAKGVSDGGKLQIILRKQYITLQRNEDDVGKH